MKAKQLIEIASRAGIGISRRKPGVYEVHKVIQGRHETKEFAGSWSQFVKFVQTLINAQQPMKLKIFGANLRDQSKGQFVVHAADCADCKKLHKLNEACCIEEHDSALSVSRSIWSDCINEGSMTADDGLSEIHFAPCVKFNR